MIELPRRSVTRFFIPLIDVLILLFCIFLLMPYVSTTTPEGGGEPAPETLSTDVPTLQRELTQARREIDRLRDRLKQSPAERLSVRVMEIDPRNGRLYYYYEGERREVRSQQEAERLIQLQRNLAGTRDAFFLVLYPRQASGYPLTEQVAQYQRWFATVPLTFDNPMGPSPTTPK